MSIENVKSNFVNTQLVSGAGQITLDLARVMFAEVTGGTSKLYTETRSSPTEIEIVDDFRELIAGAGGAGMNSGPLFGVFTNVDNGVFVSHVVVNFNAISRVDSSGSYYFGALGVVGVFTAFTLLESIEDVLGGMGHSIQDVGLFKVSKIGTAIDPPTVDQSTVVPGGGTVPDGTYYIVVTALTEVGETTPSNEVVVTTEDGGTSSIFVGWEFLVPAVAGYNVWIGQTSGGEDSFFHVDQTVNTLVIDALSGTAGTPPTTNTAIAANTREIINVKNTVYQTRLDEGWDTVFIDREDVAYIENIMDLVGS